MFRRTDFIADAIRSVLAQSFCDCEIIISDDSASEDIERLVSAFALDNIRYNPSVVRKGVARNVADSIRAARGTYVAILNDDDLWEPNFLAELTRPLLANPDCVLAFSDHWIADEHGEIDAEKTAVNSRHWGRRDLAAGELRSPATAVVLWKSVPMAVGALFRKDAIDPDLLEDCVGGAYDYWLSCLLAATGRPLHYIPLRLTRYRVHGGMETQRRDPAKGEDELLILKKILEAGWFRELGRGLDARFATVAFSVSLNKLRFGRRREARNVVAAGLRRSFRLKGVIIYIATLAPAQIWRRVRNK